MMTGHEVRTARHMGWLTVSNGELLTLAAKQFDAFVTVDRNLSFQQDLRAFEIAIIVLRSKSNRLADLRVLVPALLEARPKAKTGMATLLGT